MVENGKLCTFLRETMDWVKTLHSTVFLYAYLLTMFLSRVIYTCRLTWVFRLCGPRCKCCLEKLVVLVLLIFICASRATWTLGVVILHVQ